MSCHCFLALTSQHPFSNFCCASLAAYYYFFNYLFCFLGFLYRFTLLVSNNNGYIFSQLQPNCIFFISFRCWRVCSLGTVTYLRFNYLFSMTIDNVKFKIVSLNARGLRSLTKRKAILMWLRKQKADIAFLQETYSTKEVENIWRSQWNGSLFFSHGTEHARGVLVLVRENLDFQLKNLHTDANMLRGATGQHNWPSTLSNIHQ